METITYNLKAVTPIFCCGESKAELRPVSFKRLIRYWYRAAGAKAELNTLSQALDSTKQSASCALRIRDLNQINKEQKNKVKRYILPDRKKVPCEALRSDLKFDLELKVRNKIERVQSLESSFEIALLLGGIGQYSRRGFGSIKHKEWSFSNPQEFLGYIADQLDRLQIRDYQLKRTKLEIEEEGEYKYPGLKEVIIGRRGSQQEILERIDRAVYKHSWWKASGPDGRTTCPAYVTVNRFGDRYYPVITRLKSKKTNNTNQNRLIDFIQEVR